MRKAFFNKAMSMFVAVLSFTAVSSCVNADYELSEERLNTEITVFQEGLSLPLGKTVPLTLAELYEKLDPELKEMLTNNDGAYGVNLSGNYDLSDSLASLKNILDLDKIDFDESFSFDLSNVSLEDIEFQGQEIGPDPVDISSMVQIPEIELPEIHKKMSVSTDTPVLTTDNLNLDFGRLNLDYSTNFASLQGNFPTTDEFVASIGNLADKEMDYQGIAEMLKPIRVPAMEISTSFDEYTLEVPVSINLPAEVESIESIELSENAKVQLEVKLTNSLFTQGEICPKLDVDLSGLFVLAEGEGVTDDNHLDDDFIMSDENNWIASNTYSVSALAISGDDFERQADGSLLLDKVIDLTAKGAIEPNGLMTSVRHLHEHNEDAMTVTISLRFVDFAIDNIKMEIKPIVVEETIEETIDVEIELPEIVTGVNYVDLDNSKPLDIDISASFPETYKALNPRLEKLKITFPEGIVVEHDNYSNGTLLFENISFVTDNEKALDESIVISRINLPAPVNGKLAYNGKVLMEAVAVAGGSVVNSRDILSDGAETAAKAVVEVNADYAPELADYSVGISDYPYEVKIDSVSFEGKLPAEVGELEEVIVYLENDPVIKINLDYPTVDGKIRIVPHKELGLRVNFPKMLKFKSLNLPDGCEYVSNDQENYLNFKEGKVLPNSLELAVDHLCIRPEEVAGEGEEVEYWIKDKLEVIGGVCIEGTTVDKSVIDALTESDAKISFKADVPTLRPARLAIDQYVASIDETFEFDIVDIEDFPEMVKSVDVVDLKDVYLTLDIDASSVIEVIEEVDLSLNLDIRLPSLIKVEGAGEGNVLRVEGSLDDKGKIVVDPIHVTGLNLDDVDFTQDKIELGEQKIDIVGTVNLNDVSVDLNDLNDKNLNVAINGSLCTKNTDKIMLDKIEARVDYHIEPVTQSISLAGFTEELGDNLDFELDLNRFNLDVDLKTNLALPVEADMSIVPFFKGQPDMDRALTLDKPLTIEYSQDPSEIKYTRLRITNSKENAVAERQTIVLDLLSLIKDMPDSLQLHLEAGTQENAVFVLYPTADYVLEADYSFELPMELGDEFKLEYADTLAVPSEYSKIIVDILSSGSFGLAGKVTNGLPMQLELSASLLDADNNKIKLDEGAGYQVINRCSLDGTPVETPLNLIFGIHEDSGAKEVSSVELKFTASSGGMTGAFMDESSIQVELSALIPEGLTVDIKEINTSTNSQVSE